jgi:TIR domain
VADAIFVVALIVLCVIFAGAIPFFPTTIVNVDLSLASGLESVHHQGSSSIGIDTLVRSKGSIPEIFLRGAGVPEPFITNLKSLIGAMDPIQFYSCFISYSTKDQDFADRLYADLQAKGVRCWFAPHDVQGGRKLHEQIGEAIRLHDKLYSFT